MWEHRPPKRWVAGAAVALPVAAIVQGAILLNDFRERHSDAPTPVTPSRGVVVAVENETKTHATRLGEFVAKSVSHTGTLLEQSSRESPLRILVIGDSLAAGVGVSRTGTPVLPESIARTLSHRLGGRPVYWTCVGTPGASASRIVHDIEQYQESLLVRQPTVPTEILVTEGWIQGIQRQWKKVAARRDRVRDWWNKNTETTTTLKDEDKKVNAENATNHDSRDASPNQIARWWKRVKQRTSALRRALSDPLLPDEVDTSDVASSKLGKDSQEEQTREHLDPFQMWQRWWQRLQRRNSLRNSEIVGQFDVAIVLTGLNDLKEAVLPFMFRGKNTSTNSDYSSEKKSLMSELERVLEALQQRMKLVLDRPNEKDQEESGYTSDDDNHNVEEELLRSMKENEARLVIQRQSSRRHPLVVFPALPVSPLPIFHSQPLRSFALPLFRRVDNYKREVAKRFPGEVLFVESPSDVVFAEIEQGKGQLWEERRREQVLLRLTDVTQRASERVEAIMRQHYSKWAKALGVQEAHVYSGPTPEEAQHSSELETYHRPGRSLISVDGIHPNDDGYEFWGRHIALAIIAEWESQDLQKSTTTQQAVSNLQ